MSLLRLKRQDFYTCICGVCLVLINTISFYVVNSSIGLTVLFAVLYAVFGRATDIFCVAIRRKADLLRRHLVSSAIAVSVLSFGTGAVENFMVFLLYNIVYGGWLILANKWMRYEISPGWTMLLYDSRENLECAKAIVESRRDLMIDTCHCAYGGAGIWDGTEEKTNVVESESELDHIIRLFRIPQVLICLETGSDEIVEYCKRAGITVFVRGKTEQKGRRIDNEGLLYIRPEPGVLGYIFGKNKDGAIFR